MVQRNYEGQDGKRVYVTEVVAESVQFLEPKGHRNSAPLPTAPPPTYDDGSGRDPFAKNEERPIDISDDDLPF